MIDSPPHYTKHPSGVECITITEEMSFNLGNAVKYIWRCDLKSESPIDDLRKAKWYIEREINRLTIEKEINRLTPSPTVAAGPHRPERGLLDASLAGQWR